MPGEWRIHTWIIPVVFVRHRAIATRNTPGLNTEKDRPQEVVIPSRIATQHLNASVCVVFSERGGRALLGEGRGAF